jgi:hypothetical protein
MELRGSAAEVHLHTARKQTTALGIDPWVCSDAQVRSPRRSDIELDYCISFVHLW